RFEAKLLFPKYPLNSIFKFDHETRKSFVIHLFGFRRPVFGLKRSPVSTQKNTGITRSLTSETTIDF
ncbi:MAG: hypothetical protein D6714_16545, partial [Bacteroidetes bacterium]